MFTEKFKHFIITKKEKKKKKKVRDIDVYFLSERILLFFL